MVHIVKCILLGESGVGKTSLSIRYFEGRFSADDNNPTIGVDFHTKLTTVNGRECKIQVWDTAGQERFHSIVKSYYNSTDCAIFCFSIVHRPSFKALGKWIDDFDNNMGKRTGRILVGTFYDKHKFSEVGEDEIQELMREKHIDYYFEVSALTGTNLDNLFHTVIVTALKLNPREEKPNMVDTEIAIEEKTCCVVL